MLKVKIGDVRHENVIELLHEHHQDMLSHSPVESVHALDIKALEQPDITFWSFWLNDVLAGIVALKELSHTHGEIKSMRTSQAFLRQGIAASMLTYVIDQSNKRAYRKLSLETGTMQAFTPAHKLYQKYGFEVCEPFADYQYDPYSLFMSKTL